MKMLLTIMLTAVLIIANDLCTIGQFTAFCAFEFVMWILIKQFL